MGVKVTYEGDSIILTGADKEEVLAMSKLLKTRLTNAVFNWINENEVPYSVRGVLAEVAN